MRSIAYILLCVIMLLSSCGRKGSGKHQQSEVVADSATHFSLPIPGIIRGLDVSIQNNSRQAKAFYITPLSYDFGSYEKFVNSIVDSSMEDETKAYNLWYFISHWTNHSAAITNARLPHDPLRLVTSFQSGLCDDRNAALANLFSLAGIQSRMYHLNGHVVAEAYYDSAWHMYDADWRVFFNDEQGKVAGVEYISEHQEVIRMEAEHGFSIRNAVGPTIFKHLYGTANDNKVNTWFTNIPLDYKNELELRPGDELLLHIEKLGWEGRLRMLFGKHALMDTRHWGTLNRKLKTKSEEYIYVEHSPYAVTSIAVNPAKGNNAKTSVYYSSDSLNWVFKGLIGDGISNVTFTPVDTNGLGIVFNYYLKFVSDNEFTAEVEVKNSILFSERVLINNGGEFRVMPLRGEGKLNVDMRLNYMEPACQ